MKCAREININENENHAAVTMQACANEMIMVKSLMDFIFTLESQFELV